MVKTIKKKGFGKITGKSIVQIELKNLKNTCEKMYCW